MNSLRFCRVVTLVISALAIWPAIAAELTVIDLRHRTATEVIPVLRPLVSPDTALSGVDYKLLVRGSVNEVARIREVLAVLDRAPKQLLISVRYSGGPQNRTTEFGAGANVNNGNAQVNVRGGAVTRSASESNVSSVRVLEGNSAHVSSGQAIPMITAAYVPAQITGGGSSGFGVVTEYRDVTSGFNVLPRINGDRVVLEIATQQQRLADANSSNVAVQRADTTVAGQLGEWIDLGGVDATVAEQRTSMGIAGGSRRIATQSDRRMIAIKVEQVD